MFSFPVYELQFPLLLDTMIANTEFEFDGSGTNSPSPEKKRKRGLGKGGAAAKYCTISVAAVLDVVAHSKKLKFCIDVNFLSIMRFMAQFNGDIEDRLV